MYKARLPITSKGDDYPNCRCTMPVFVYLCVTVARDCTEAENTVNLTKLEFMTRAKRLSNTDIPIYPIYHREFAVFLYVPPDSV